MKLRHGTVADIPVLDAIALEAKAHWGYDAAQLDRWRADLAVNARTLAQRPVCLAERQGQPIGFIQVATDTRPWELWGMWVLPAHMRAGVGTALLAWAEALAASAGQTELAIDADPHAEPFYLARGAQRVGTVAAPIEAEPHRIRPQLRLRVAAAFAPAAEVLRPAVRVLAQSSSTPSAGDRMSLIAKGTFNVKLAPLPFEGQPGASKLGRMSIDKQIAGDLVATTQGQMLSAMTDTKGSAGYVAIERVEGTLHGKAGSFVPQHTGSMNRGAPELSVTVVPDSATGELAGLTGTFKIIMAEGRHSYEFSYTLP